MWVVTFASKDRTQIKVRRFARDKRQLAMDFALTMIDFNMDVAVHFEKQ